MNIHTLELNKKIKISTFKKIRNHIFELSVGHANTCFEDKQSHRITFSGWASVGITIHLSYTSGGEYFCYLRLRINPSKLLGNSEPTALFLPTPENIALLGQALIFHLNRLPVTCHISDFSLYRVDLCQDQHSKNQAELLEYLRLLKSGASPSRWDLHQFGDERDEHSFRCRNSRYQVTAYDKFYEILQRKQQGDYAYAPLLRLEVALFSPGIHYLCSNGYLPNSDWLTQLLVCGTDGSVIIGYVLKRLLPPGDYFTFEGAQQVIQESCFPHSKQNKLCAFLLEINRTDHVDTISVKAKKNGKKRLQQLCELNINPVLISPNAQTSHLPSLFPRSCI